MKICWFFVMALIGLCSSYEREVNVLNALLRYEEGQRYFYFPDGDGNLHLVDVEKQDIGRRFSATNDVQFLLFTRKNPRSPDYLRNKDFISLILSYFDKSKPVKIVAHGWMSDGSSEINKLLVDAFLKAQDANVICVDWGKGSNGFYSSAVSNVHQVGAFLGKFVDWLIDEGVNVENIHLMGHSLGAHLTAIAARSITKGIIPMLTGFDPANPLWDDGSERIRGSDAKYVEVIHTNAGHLGLKYPVGNNDFYPNGGFLQPGCSIFSIGCAHSRSYEYFAESLIYPGYEGVLCSDYDELSKGKCSNKTKILMGGLHPKPSLGVFYLETGNQKPFFMVS